MSTQVCNGAVIKCNQAVPPGIGSLVVLPANRVLTSNQPAANIMDHIPITNIPSFGACKSLANPTVAAATSAAMGALTPMPCVPATAAPWTPGSPKVLIANMPALNKTSKLMCMFGGQIEISYAGQATHQIP